MSFEKANAFEVSAVLYSFYQSKIDQFKNELLIIAKKNNNDFYIRNSAAELETKLLFLFYVDFIAHTSKQKKTCRNIIVDSMLNQLENDYKQIIVGNIDDVFSKRASTYNKELDEDLRHDRDKKSLPGFLVYVTNNINRANQTGTIEIEGPFVVFGISEVAQQYEAIAISFSDGALRQFIFGLKTLFNYSTDVSHIYPDKVFSLLCEGAKPL